MVKIHWQQTQKRKGRGKEKLIDYLQNSHVQSHIYIGMIIIGLYILYLGIYMIIHEYTYIIICRNIYTHI
jgi:hypothetical protein